MYNQMWTNVTVLLSNQPFLLDTDLAACYHNMLWENKKIENKSDSSP